jgi:hypothetical protein
MKRWSPLMVPFVLIGCTDATMPGSNDMSLRRTDVLVDVAAAEAVLPSAYTSVMGETSNTFPHSFKNLRYQQVFLGTDVVNPVIVGLCLRRDDVFGGVERTQTLTVTLGPTALDYTNLGSNFASNYSATPTEVFTGDVVIPAAAPATGTPADFDFCIPFTQSYTHPAGSNLIVEVVNTSLVSGNVPRDACDVAVACTTARAFAFSATGENAILVMRGGLVMKFLSPEPPKPVDPQSKDECMKGGWTEFDFRNQGQCVRFIETGVDSRV